MTADHLIGIERFEADLWKVADNLRANSNLASNEYFLPILGLIFLRQATNRYYAAVASIEEDKAAGRMPDRPLVEADFTRRRALLLPEPARYDALLERRKDGSRGAAVSAAMDAVEGHFPPLAGQLPKDYERFEDDVLEEIWNEGGNGEARDNPALHAGRESLHGMAERGRNLARQIDLAAKLAGRVVDTAVKELGARDSDRWPNAEIGKARRSLEGARGPAVEALRRAHHFVHQADWLQERFPDARLRDVEGLVKLVERGEVEAHDWSLTPGRYVGVAPEEEDEDFDFEEALRSIHLDLKGLNEEAERLAARIARNFEELGV